MRTIPAVCIAVSMSISMAASVHAAGLTKESLSEIKENLDEEKAVLVDVREKREWDNGHIDGALFFPLSRLQYGITDEDLKRLPKDKTLYVHCVVGQRAVRAGNILERYGYKVRPIKPGYREMISAGFPKSTATD